MQRLQQARPTGVRPVHAAGCVRRGVTVAGLLLAAVPAGARGVQVTACDGLAAGSLVLSEEVAAVFVVRYSAGRVTLEALFIARGAAGWAVEDHTFQPWRRPELPDSTGFLTGASVGRLFMQYEPVTRTAWVHTTRARLDDDNVILVDSAHAEPRVRRLLRVDPVIPFPAACEAREQNDFNALRRAVLEKLMRTTELKRLVGY
ncbi:MAG TPA: hypothetical protein VMN60_05955 [Longimicrobiales bacterium]|nr:hypothetical protein [Longimicrobiales bacterium]